MNAKVIDELLEAMKRCVRNFVKKPLPLFRDNKIYYRRNVPHMATCNPDVLTSSHRRGSEEESGTNPLTK